MVRFSSFTAAAAALFFFGVEAGPCRPLTTSLDSTAITTLADATTTILAEPTAITTETDLAESASSIASDTTIASVGVTTTTTFAESTTTAHAESTTTTVAPACVETQLLSNPGFDNSNSDIAPWTTNNGAITQSSPQSGANALAYSFNDSGYNAGIVEQTVTDLDGTYEFSYYYRIVSISPGADFVCDIELSVGGTTGRGAIEDSVGGWKTASIILTDLSAVQASLQFTTSCRGEYRQIQVNIDTLEFKRICSL
ncbi:uncharacterized protein B0J16DRAFT_404105 [Fusarium flagelliforme]|uniref:CBM-cenC domain-containing protein n=1 Tax=Fusarium flagelliforme TaxID=2675880 RepID=A0A395MBL2_9HYPO|nr:uncharacterized protein B0J16DRAFT_404105 [Fusarium flagelliforme]KAH7174433.1 hypothetical protein B0J16DRAFT_404105 [Fusarium flagelliforme]RFN45302.1 hypothetical protein FIE12Z_10451 [Fusarium flagelliforme]